MKRIGNLFDKTFTHDALLEAFYVAAKHKRGKRACFNFEKQLSKNIDDLYKEILNGTYKTKPYFSFTVHEPKKRIIYAPAFRDLVVQHAIYKIIYPIFNKSFIDQSYACRKGKGTHKASDYAQSALRSTSKDSYTLKTDVYKFFYNIDRNILKSLIEKKIKDKKMVSIIMKFADHGKPIGIPIGNLLSQLFALIYLNPLDQYIKHELKIKKYCRYVDDCVLFGLTKRNCILLLESIKLFLFKKLHLKLSYYIISAKIRGVNFVGYRTWKSRRFIRKHSLYKFRKAVKSGQIKVLKSILGHANKTSSIFHLVHLS